MDRANPLSELCSLFLGRGSPKSLFVQNRFSLNIPTSWEEACGHEMQAQLFPPPKSAHRVLFLPFSFSEICVRILLCCSCEAVRQDTRTGPDFVLFLGCGTSPGGGVQAATANFKAVPGMN